MLENLLRRWNDLLETCCNGNSGSKNTKKETSLKKKTSTRRLLKNKKQMWKKGYRLLKEQKKEYKIEI